jgi:hypothetical protein
MMRSVALLMIIVAAAAFLCGCVKPGGDQRPQVARDHPEIFNYKLLSESWNPPSTELAVDRLFPAEVEEGWTREEVKADHPMTDLGSDKVVRWARYNKGGTVVEVFLFPADWREDERIKSFCLDAARKQGRKKGLNRLATCWECSFGESVQQYMGTSIKDWSIISRTPNLEIELGWFLWPLVHAIGQQSDSGKR